jgi:NADH-quinone oxidoreductase subunit C
MSKKVVAALEAKFKQWTLASHDQAGDETVTIAAEGLVPIVTFLRDDPEMAFNMFIDATGVDYLGFPDHTGPRFAVVYHLYSLTKKHRIRLRVPLEEANLVVDSLSHLYLCANWFERETWDMYGVRFSNSPDHRRILLYEEFEGHPLRKDYPQRGYQPLLPMPTLPRADQELPALSNEDL